MSQPKIITARFPGKCRYCGDSVERGESIAYWGKGQPIAHAECLEGLEREDGSDDEDGDSEREWPPPKAVLAADRRSHDRGVSVFRFSSGAVSTQNRRGRCIDAPCCGCCS